MTRSASDIRGPNCFGSTDDGNTVIAGCDKAVRDGDVGGVRDMNPVGIGAVARCGHVEIGSGDIVATVENNLNLLRISDSQVPHCQTIAPVECQCRRRFFARLQNKRHQKKKKKS